MLNTDLLKLINELFQEHHISDPFSVIDSWPFKPGHFKLRVRSIGPIPE